MSGNHFLDNDQVKDGHYYGQLNINFNNTSVPDAIYCGEEGNKIRINNNYFNYAQNKLVSNVDLQEGDVFIPNSFTSTSIEGINAGNLAETPNTSFTRGIKNLDYIINAPAGQSYLYPNVSNIQNYTTEMEAILPKNLQFKVDKVVSDLDRGYLGTAADIKRGEYYGIGDKKFTKVPNRFFPSIQRFDKVKTVNRDLNTGELTYGKVSKKGVKNLIKYHNEQPHPVIPKYYFSMVNPYLFGGTLNKNC